MGEHFQISPLSVRVLGSRYGNSLERNASSCCRVGGDYESINEMVDKIDKNVALMACSALEFFCKHSPEVLERVWEAGWVDTTKI